MVRNIAADWFRPASLKQWEDRIRELAQEGIAARLNPGPNELDIVGDFSLCYPLHVIMTLLGVPAEDEARMMALTQEFFGTTDPESQRADVTPLNPEAAAQQWSAAIRDFYAYFDALVEARRAEPALFTTTSTGPSAASIARTAAAGLVAAAFGPAAAPLGLYGILVLVWGTAAASIVRQRR